jgi:putative nucleotidyltransferase with HDIG domain
VALLGCLVLVVQSGLFQGSKYPIYVPFRIGRHPDNDLQLTDPKVSRFHAIIDPTENDLWVRDLGSRNGTWVNGQTVGEIALKEGDEIRVGNTRMKVEGRAESEDLAMPEARTIAIRPEILGRVRLKSPVEHTPPWVKVEPTRIESDMRGHVFRLQALYQTNLLLNSETDLQGIFARTLEQLLQFLPADRGAILFLEPRSRELTIRYSLVRAGQPIRNDILVSQSILREIMEEGYGMLIEDARSDQRFGLSDSIVEQDVRSVLCVPLVDRGQTLGMIYLDVLGRSSAFDEEDLQMLTAMVAPAAVQIRNIQYLQQLEQAYVDTLHVLANAIEARDHYTVGHTWRVTRIALAIAGRMGWSPDQRRYAEMGGILHDIGKIAVEDAILRKTGPLTPEEFQKMQLHPEHGARMLKDVEFLKPVIPYVLFHQERWDGQGYPFRLKGDDVPQEGRLLAVCDAFDAMTSHRPYRESRGPKEAVEEIKEHRGSQFDPAMVDVFLDVWGSGSIVSILQDYAREGESIPCPFCSTHIPLGQKPKKGVILECPVCSKNCVVLQEVGEWKGELV